MVEQFIKWTLIIFGLSLMYSCISNLDFDTEANIEEILSIQASLVKGKPHTFTANVTTLVGFEGTFAGGIGTTLVLINDLGQQIDVPKITSRDFRLEIPEDSPDFTVEDFMYFQIRIAANDGRTFESSMEQLLPVPTIEELKFSLVEVLEPGALGRLIPKTRLRFTVSTSTIIPNSQDNVSLRWTFEEVVRVTDNGGQVCYVTQGIRSTEEKVFIPTFLTGTDLEDFEVFVGLIRAEHGEGNYAVALQQSLTPSAAKYFQSLGELIDRDPSIFTGPAGKLQSNIMNINDPNEDVFGYFYATTIDTARVFISPESVGSPLPCCVFAPSRALECTNIDCRNCLNTENSTLEQPIWW